MEERLHGGMRDIAQELKHDPVGVCETSRPQQLNAVEAAPTISVVVEVSAHHRFPTALAAVMEGNRITRLGWNARGQYVTMHFPEKRELCTVRYLVLKNAGNHFVPWVPSQGDLFALDWAILPR